MNTGLHWIWVEILAVMMDWIGLDLEKWTHGHLCDSLGCAAAAQTTICACLMDSLSALCADNFMFIC